MTLLGFHLFFVEVVGVVNHAAAIVNRAFLVDVNVAEISLGIEIWLGFDHDFGQIVIDLLERDFAILDVGHSDGQGFVGHLRQVDDGVFTQIFNPSVKIGAGYVLAFGGGDRYKGNRRPVAVDDLNALGMQRHYRQKHNKTCYY